MEIVVTDDLERLIEELGREPNSEIFFRDQLKIDDLELIRERAYLKEKGGKKIIIAGKKYNLYFQNGLLKLLEEPPPGVDFTLLTLGKHHLIDTIRSRLPLRYRFFHRKKITSKKWNSRDILELMGKKDLEKEEVKEFIYSLYRPSLEEEKLKALGDALQMVELNIDRKGIIGWLYLKLEEGRG
ncbi:MAG: DNA polymerase III subunit delta' [Epsilonproteobacteria bacterium]|jgi:DNA polymerase-3 subunit delta'|nr:DNA polymerase III subunit delta' [Campylobacterota bacterium]NPA89474.1 DNA polymerase III subunit delta' [Campylobacterota bacterium]